MAGYIIVSVDVKDPDTYKTYAQQVAPTLEPFGGEFLVRGGAFTVEEGEWPRPRVVIIQFPSVEQARAWYESETYRPLRDLRQSASDANLIIVEGA